LEGLTGPGRRQELTPVERSLRLQLFVLSKGDYRN